MARSKVQVHPEQLYVAAVLDDGRFAIGGEVHSKIPWKVLNRCFIYALAETDLMALLNDAVLASYMILDGSVNERRGVRAFKTAIGAWGCHGRVEVCTVDAWCIDADKTADLIHETGRIQALLRQLCVRLNQDNITFRSSGLRWLNALYRELNNEPDGMPDPLDSETALFCRQAHVGGPIVHIQTTLEPFVRIDRDRAYGSAMLEDLPCGLPYEIPLNNNGIKRWRPRDLQATMGIVDATVEVDPGPLVPLLPVTKWNPIAKKTVTIYPTGTLRGKWTIHELTYLEESGRGRVTEIHRAIGFEARPVFAPIIRYIRRREADMPIKVKRLEHILYGRCARSMQMTRFATGYSGGQPLLGDIIEPHVLRRLGPDARITRFPLKGGGKPLLPLYKVSGKVSGGSSTGTMDRPDRSAWITATNRIEMCKIVDALDVALGAKRSGEYVGRIYVDGIDVQAKVEDIPDLPGCSVRMEGSSIRIFRAGAYAAHLWDGSIDIEAAGTSIPRNCTEKDLQKALAFETDADRGPFAGGRAWPEVKGVADPRLVPDQKSEPLHLDLEMVKTLGFYTETTKGDS